MQEYIKEKLEKLAGVIAPVLKLGHPESEFQADIIKISDVATGVKITLGDRVGFLKLFADGDDAQAAFDRERRALDILHGGQVPRLLLIAEAERAILTEYIKGQPLADTLHAENVIQTAEHLGQWFGRLSNHAPTEKADETWAVYLKGYSDGFDQEVLKQQTPILDQSTISRRVLSHNDNALGNFILGADKRLYAVDFEDCRMKPEGWDLVTAGRALFGQAPEQLDLIAGSLLRGYQLTAKECALAGNFDQVISVLAVAMVTAKA